MLTNRLLDVAYDTELIDEILAGKQEVILYGIGAIGEREIPKLIDVGIRIKCGADQDENKWGKRVSNILIKSPDECLETDVPVIVMTKAYFQDAVHSLKRKGVKNILPLFFYKVNQGLDEQEFVDYKIFANIVNLVESIEGRDGKFNIVLPSLELHITEKCSLKCKECSNLMQYIAKPVEADYDKMIEATERLLSVVDGVYELKIIGGEPLVSPNLAKYINRFSNNDKVGNITILTNGTIVPKADLLDALKNDKVFVRISNYGKLSRKISEIRKVLDENDIFYSVYPEKKWFKCVDFTYRNLSENALQNMYEQCCSSYLLSIKNGLLYACPYAACVAGLEIVPPDVNEYVDVLNAEGDTLQTQLKEIINKKYLKVCNYCMGRPKGFVSDIPAAEQTKETLKYKRYWE